MDEDALRGIDVLFSWSINDGFMIYERGLFVLLLCYMCIKKRNHNINLADMPARAPFTAVKSSHQTPSNSMQRKDRFPQPDSSGVQVGSHYCVLTGFT